MKQKIVSTVCLLLWMLVLPVPAYAQSDMGASVYTGYWAEDSVYLFGDFSQEYVTGQEMAMFVNNQERGTANPTPVLQSNATIHYMLLIDVSTSTEPYQSFVNRFASELMMAETQNLMVSVAAFDQEFRMIASDLTEWEDVQNALWSLRYQHDGSNICGSVAEALLFLGKESYAGGEMSNLVVISDGKPWYSKDIAEENALEAQNSEKAVTAMSAYSDIAVHTVCFREWEEKTASALLTEQGLHMEAPTVPQAGEAGRALAEFTDNLYSLQFSLTGYTDAAEISDVMLMGANHQWISLGNIRNIELIPSINDNSVIPENTTKQTSEIPAEETEPTENIEPTTETQNPEDPSATQVTESTDSEDSTQADASVPAEAYSTATEDDQIFENDDGSWWKNRYVCAVMVTAVVVCAGLTALILRICHRKRLQKDGIRVRAEVLSGDVAGLKKIYFLYDDLTIGTGKKCDIVLRDTQAALVNTRIFMRDQIIYIEDMHSPSGTTLNGMRIYSPNRLRSGDHVGIGNVTLQFLF